MTVVAPMISASPEAPLPPGAPVVLESIDTYEVLAQA
jgi:hypothetical protein